jgi:hypothetical protein
MAGEAVQQFFGFPLLIIIPPLLHTRLSPPHEVWDSAAHGLSCKFLCLKVVQKSTGSVLGRRSDERRQPVTILTVLLNVLKAN